MAERALCCRGFVLPGAPVSEVEGEAEGELGAEHQQQGQEE